MEGLIRIWPLYLIIALLIPVLKPLLKGYVGEKKVSVVLSLLPSSSYFVLHDVMLKTDTGTTQIDHIVVSVYGIFVIETKNYKGRIYGDDSSVHWTQALYRQKNRFKNPVHQNYGHCKAVEKLVGVSVISIVAFSVRSRLFVSSSDHVIYIPRLLKVIRSYKEPVIPLSSCEAIKDLLIKNNIQDKKERSEHVSRIKTNAGIVEAKVRDNICPRCNGQLIQRKGEYGTFTGCSNYPKCKYTYRRET